MKKCPFCAEEIQDAAIKCRFCNSFLSAAPPAAQAAAAAPAAPAPAAASAPAADDVPKPFFARATKPDAKEPDYESPSNRKVFYEGVPSWKAYLGYYLVSGFGAALMIVILNAISGGDAALTTKFFNTVIPVGVAVVFMFGVSLKRKSIKFRVTSTAIETETGLFSKSIDVLQLWRCRDVRYKQTFVDRILGIAHVEVFAQDATTPHLEIVGMPASRQLFEQLRDSIEIQRQAKNVYGVIS